MGEQPSQDSIRGCLVRGVAPETVVFKVNCGDHLSSARELFTQKNEVPCTVLEEPSEGNKALRATKECFERVFPGVGGQPADRRGCHLPPVATQTLSLPVSVSMYTDLSLSLSLPRLFIWRLCASFFCPFLFLILIPLPYLPSSLDFLSDLSVSHLSVLKVSPSLLLFPCFSFYLQSVSQSSLVPHFPVFSFPFSFLPISSLFCPSFLVFYPFLFSSPSFP